MNLRKVMVLGLILWVLTFVGEGLLIIGLKMKEGSIHNLSYYLYLAFVTSVISFIYYKYERIPRKKGMIFLVGLAITISFIIMDLAITFPILLGDYSQLFKKDFFVEYIIIFAIFSISGSVIRKVGLYRY